MENANYRKPSPGRMTAERALILAAEHEASAAICKHDADVAHHLECARELKNYAHAKRIDG